MRLTSAFAIKITSNVWTVAVGFLTSVILNRAMGPIHYGTLVLACSAVMFAWFFVDLGAGAGLSRFLPQHLANHDLARASALVRVGWWCVGIGISAFGIALWGLADWLALAVFRQPHLAPLLRLSLCYFVTFSLLNYTLQFLQANQTWRSESLLSALYPTIYFAGCLLLIPLGLVRVESVIVVNATAALLTILMLWISLSPLQRQVLFGAAPMERPAATAAWRDIRRFGSPLLFTNLVFFIMVWVDKVLLSRYRSLEEVTYYYVGFAFFNALVVISKTFYTVLLPYVSRITAEGPERLQRTFRIVFFGFLQIALAVSVLTAVWIGPLVSLCYGPTYQVAATVCTWLLVVFVLRMLTNAMTLFLLNAFGLGNVSAALSGILMVIQLSGDLLLIPRFGWLGAVWASILAYVAHGLVLAVGVSAIRRLFSWSLVLGSATFGGLLVAMSWLLWRWTAPWHVLTVPLLVLAFSAAVLWPIVRDRYQWKPVWEAWTGTQAAASQQVNA